MQITDVTSRYNRFESWAYDRFTGPALSDWIADQLLGSLLADVPEKGTVLDVGCGGGYLPLAVQAERPDLTVTGLDLSPDLIRWASQRADERDSDACFVRGNALDLPFPDDTFDLVLSVGSIKHWPDRPDGLRECVRVLKPERRLCVLEADRTVRWGTAWTFIGELNFPAIFRLPFLPYFKYVVAGEGLSEKDARGLLETLNLSDPGTDTLKDKPLVRLQGKK